MWQRHTPIKRPLLLIIAKSEGFLFFFSTMYSWLRAVMESRQWDSSIKSLSDKLCNEFWARMFVCVNSTSLYLIKKKKFQTREDPCVVVFDNAGVTLDWYEWFHSLKVQGLDDWGNICLSSLGHLGWSVFLNNITAMSVWIKCNIDLIHMSNQHSVTHILLTTWNKIRFFTPNDKESQSILYKEYP
jgi:hypothetical protein